MKKVLFITAFFALAACSEDVYQEIDQQNEDMMAPPTFNYDGPGHYNGPGDFSDPWGYYSPWDIWYRATINVPYGIFNNVPELTMYVRAYIGLAYYDGNNNGTFVDLAPGGPSINLTIPGQYPDLYANSQEVGNLIPSVWITAEPELFFSADGPFSHCPVLNGNVGYNVNNQYFHLPTATTAERQLLASYGKVFFYEVEVRDATNTLVFTDFLQIECETLTEPGYLDWEGITNPPVGGPGPNGYIPSPAGYSAELSYYNNFFNSTIPTSFPMSCNSKEIVYDTQYPSNHSFPYGSDWYEVDLKMAVGHPMWRSANLHLVLRKL